MSRNQDLKRVLLAAAFASAAVALAGCGKQGVLEQPAPLFGARAKANYEAEKAQEAKDEAQRATLRGTTVSTSQSAGDNAPRTSRDVLDPAQKLTPASSTPIAGAPNPVGPPIQTTPSN